MRARFRRFRVTRPFWAGLWTLAGGAVIFVLPISPITSIIRAGLGAFGGVLLGIIIMAMGLFMWFSPGQRKFAGIASIVVGLVAYPVTNMGGFVVGMLYAIVGGCLALSWVPDKPRKGESPRTTSARHAREDQGA